MKRILAWVLSLACLVTAAETCWGFLENVEILPPRPLEGERVTARVSGYLPDSCWGFTGHEIEALGGEFVVEILANHQGGQCLDVVVPYAFDADLGVPDAGGYRVTIVDPQETSSLEFEVMAVRLLLPGDANGDGSLDVADPVFILVFLFAAGAPPPCENTANADGEDDINVTDAVFILNFLFASGPSPFPPLVDCLLAEQCVFAEWPIFCAGHWDCDCGECKSVCDAEGCGDGICDFASGETPQSCPADCKPEYCRPVCRLIGTKSEGWYDSCTQRRHRWASCATCWAECRFCGSESEGWYDSCTGELIISADCDCP